MAIENLTTTRLSNGLPVLIKESHVAPVASFWIFYRVGSRNELPGKTGISHWLEHMLFKGSERFPRGEFDKAIAAFSYQRPAEHSASYQGPQSSRLPITPPLRSAAGVGQILPLLRRDLPF